MSDNAELKISAVRGFAWVTAFSGVSRGVQYLVFLILGVLLKPEDFGTFALALVLINALIMFREMGLTPVLIQKQDNVDDAFNVALVLLPIYGIVLYILIYIAAIPFAWFVKNNDIIGILRILGLTVPISSFGILPSAWFQRELDFKRKVMPETFSAIVGGIFTVIFAYMGIGVWSFVWGRIITEFIRTVAFWIASGWRWKPVWNLKIAVDLFKFGSIVSLGSAIDFAYIIIDQLFVGLMGVKALGNYSFSFRLCTASVTGLTVQLGTVMLPVMAKLQGDLKKLSSVVGKNIALNALITVPIAAGLFFFSQDLLDIIYGDKWDEAKNLFKILALYSVVWGSFGPLINLYIVMNKAKYFPLISLYKIILVLVGMIWVFKIGTPEAIAYLFTVVALICYIYAYYIAAKLLRCNILYLLYFNLPSLIAVLPGFILIEILRYFHANLFYQITGFYALFILLTLLINRDVMFEIISIFRKMISEKMNPKIEN